MSIVDTILDKIGAILTGLAAAGAFVVSLFNLKKAKEIHVQINSRMDQLLLASGVIQKAEGKAEGRAEEKADERERLTIKPATVVVVPAPQVTIELPSKDGKNSRSD